MVNGQDGSEGQAPVPGSDNQELQEHQGALAELGLLVTCENSWSLYTAPYPAAV